MMLRASTLIRGAILSLLLALCFQSAGAAQIWPIDDDSVQLQNKTYQDWWSADWEADFAKLPTEGAVDAFRVPYAGYMYPDRGGGTLNPLYKYDQAVHGGRGLASGHERWDISVHTETKTERRGLFGRRVVRSQHVPHWSGHCNAWTAAAIRHAEPQQNVVHNGVTFSPADIKGLLAELYMYTDTEVIGGSTSIVNPGSLHLILANWLGRQKHPVAMDGTLGREVWNYPIYSYKSTLTPHDQQTVEVRTDITYKMYTDREYDKAPENKQSMHFHYVLNLDRQGRVLGGRYYNDSNRIDMLWIPRRATPPGEAGNEKGNPHLDVDQVLALWRKSVSDESVAGWRNVDEPKVATAANTPSGEAVDTAESSADNGTAGPDVESPPAPVVAGGGD